MIDRDELRIPSSSDGLSTTNQSNLALKGIIGVGAMGKISDLLDQASDADKYSVCDKKRTCVSYGPSLTSTLR